MSKGYTRRKRWMGWGAWVLLVMVQWAAPTGQAQAVEEATPQATALPQTTATPAPVQVTPESIDALRQEIAGQLDVARKTVASASGVVAPEVIEQQKLHVQLLEQIDLVLNQQLNVLQQGMSFTSNKTQLDEQLTQVRSKGPPEQPPYSFLLLDNLRTEWRNESDKRTSVEDAIKAAQSTLEQAKKALDDKDKAQALFREEINRKGESASPLELARLRTMQLESRVAKRLATLRELELQNQKLSKDAFETRVQVLQERLQWIEKQTLFTEKDLNERLDRFKSQQTSLQDSKIKAQDNLKRALAGLESAQKRLAAEIEPNPFLIEDELARRYERDLYQEEIKYIDERISRLAERVTVWQQRFDLFNGNAPNTQIDEWYDAANTRNQSLHSEENLQNSLLANKRKEQSTLDAKMETYKDQPKVLAKLSDQEKYLKDLIANIESSVASIQMTRLLYQILAEEIEKERAYWSWSDLLASTGARVNAYFDYVIWKIDDENYLTVRKAIKALIYFIVGLYVARFFSRRLARLLKSRFSVHEGAAAAIQSLLFYSLFVIIFLITLDAIYINITAFAFLGGALAIGIGFGSQNILSNFISGLILLMERPVRVGDLVEIEGTSGTITRIGLRCTQIMTFTNIDVLVPNSYFLENRVINLTLSDRLIRTTLKVGVAYGSDTREVQKLIRKAVDEHGLIMKKPEPFVVFSDFGDNCLMFEVRFWLTLDVRTNKLIVESDVRHRINNLFREAGIVIAFPQRDLHLDTLTPIEVRVMPPKEEGK